MKAYTPPSITPGMTSPCGTAGGETVECSRPLTSIARATSFGARRSPAVMIRATTDAGCFWREGGQRKPGGCSQSDAAQVDERAAQHVVSIGKQNRHLIGRKGRQEHRSRPGQGAGGQLEFRPSGRLDRSAGRVGQGSGVGFSRTDGNVKIRRAKFGERKIQDCRLGGKRCGQAVRLARQ